MKKLPVSPHTMPLRPDVRFAGEDMVNSPPHYQTGGIETIDFIQAKLSPEEFAGYCRGNALKYLSRAGHKDATAQEIGKAIWYLERWRSALDAA